MKLDDLIKLKENKFIKELKKINEIRNYLISIGINKDYIYYNNDVFLTNDINLLLSNSIKIIDYDDGYEFYINCNCKNFNEDIFYTHHIEHDAMYNIYYYETLIKGHLDNNLNLDNRKQVKAFAKKVAKELLVKDILE
jgi:hypothetical protein